MKRVIRNFPDANCGRSPKCLTITDIQPENRNGRLIHRNQMRHCLAQRARLCCKASSCTRL